MKKSSNDSLLIYKCTKCYDSRYIVDLNTNGKINIEICKDCVTDDFSQEIIGEASARCKKINSLNLNPDDPKELSSYIKTISTKKEYSNIVQSLNKFKERYPEIKKKITHNEIINNPQNFRIVRPIENYQFTALHLFTRNQVFQIISKENRAKKTKIDDYGKTIDISENRTFLGWGGNTHFEISGPVLCDYDQKVFDACVKLWHLKCKKGITLETNLSEIWKTIGNSSHLSKINRESLRLSVKRLVTVAITASSMNKNNRSFWSGGIFDSVIYKDSNENKVSINFNKYMVESYLEGTYAILNHDVYNSLLSYSKKIYVFLMSHDNPTRQISLEKLRPLIGISNDVLNDSFIKAVNNSVKELKTKKILDSTSKIENGILYSVILKEAWEARPTSNATVHAIL